MTDADVKTALAGMDLTSLRDELIRDEGIRLRVYNDSRGIPTIGIGRNLRDKGISFDEATYLFHHDINEHAVDLTRVVPWCASLDPVRHRVLLNMCFNLGAGGLLRFTRMLAAAEQGDFETAALEMKASRWATQVGARADRLAAMMRTGVTV